MSDRKRLIFAILLVAAVFFQVVVLGWGWEAVFFITWFLLVACVKHDTRLSSALGLVFLAACPFLLIAGKEPVAEQAANYAYFFLAIGVLVQVEEMILERVDRLGWKVDLSPLWDAVAGQLGARPGVTVPGTVTNPGRTIPVVWILIAGIGGWAVFSLLAALSGVSRFVLLPLLGGSIFFFLLVFGLHLAFQAFGWSRLSGFSWLLLLIPMIVMAGIWINDLATGYRFSRMGVAYNFIEQLDGARHSLSGSEGEAVEVQVWTIGAETKTVLYQHPALSGASRIFFPVSVAPGSRLTFDLALSPDSWEKPGDGVDFAVYVDTGQGIQRRFSTYIDPKNDELDRRWHTYSVDLDAFAGQDISIIFETGTGPAGDYRYDWAGWGEPRLLAP